MPPPAPPIAWHRVQNWAKTFLPAAKSWLAPSPAAASAPGPPPALGPNSPRTIRGRASAAFTDWDRPVSPGTGKPAPHFGHLIPFPSGNVPGTLRVTSQDGQAILLVNIVENL